MIGDYISCSQSLTGNTITEALPLLLCMENEGRAFYNSFPYRVWERENEKYNSFPYRVWEREIFLTFRFTNIALITESITVATQGIAMALPVNFRMV